MYKYPALSLFLAHFKIVLHRKLKNLSYENNMTVDSSLIESLEYSYLLFEKFAGKKPLIPTKSTASKDYSKASEFLENIKKKQKALRSIS